MTEDVNGGAEDHSTESDMDDAGEEDEQQEAAQSVSVPSPRVGPEFWQGGMGDDRFPTTIRLRGELGKPAMTGEGSEDELTVKIKVAGSDLSDLHHSLRPYAGRTIEAVILPLQVAEEKLPWETPPHPDQTQLPLEGEAQEVADQFICIACGASCEIGIDGHCPACGGALRCVGEAAPAEEESGESGGAYANGGEEATA